MRHRHRVRAACCLPPILLVALAAACSAGRPPVIAAERAFEGTLLLHVPEVAIGADADAPRARALGELLADELGSALAGQGVVVDGPWRGPAAERSRSQILERLRRARADRLRPGLAIPVEEALAPAREAGASSVLVARLVRRASATEGGFVPRAPGEIVELPEHRPDYKIPTAEEYATGGVDLELLVVDAATSRVVAHRRVSHPVRADEIEPVVADLVRLAARGFRGRR